MAGRDLAEQAVEGYLATVAGRLVGPRTVRVAILHELRDGLHEAVAAGARRGESGPEAVRAALREFGPPAAIAAGFAAELGCSHARRTVTGYLATGPVIGLLWLLMLTPPGWWPRNVVALWQAVPAAPAIGFAVLSGGLVLAATGRASRWMTLPPRHILNGAITVVAAAALGDLLMLILATRSAPVPGSPLIGALAVTASVIRLGVGVPTTARSLRVRRCARTAPPH
jgi:hypothetical protein